MKKLLFIGLLLVSFNTFSQNNVKDNQTRPYFRGSVKVKDTLGVENIFLVDTIRGFSSSTIIIADTVSFLIGMNFSKISADTIGTSDNTNQIYLDSASFIKFVEFLNTVVINGSVGIGTSPSSIFHIKAAIPGTVGSHPAGQLIIQNPADDTTANVVITAYESDGNGDPDQQLWYLGNSSSGDENIIFLNRRNANLTLGTNGIVFFKMEGDGDIVLFDGTADKDFTLTFNGETNDGIITYMEDEDRFDVDNDFKVSGDATISQRMAVGATASIDTKVLLKVSETQTTTAVSHFGYGMFINPTLAIEHGGSFLRGISAAPTMSGAGTDGTLQAIHALATYNNTTGGATVNAISAKISSGGSALAPLNPAVIIIESPTFSGTKPINYHGLHINNQGVSGITTSYGLKIEDQSLSGTFYSIKTGVGIVEFGDSLIVKDNLEVSGNLTVTGDIGIFGTQGFADSNFTIAMTQDIFYNITNSSSDLYTTGVNIGDLVFTGDSIQVVTAGHYEISYDLSFSGANQDKYHLELFVNNVEQSGKGETERDMSITDVGVSAASTILNIGAGQWIVLKIKNVQNNNDATLKAGNFTVKKL